MTEDWQAQGQDLPPLNHRPGLLTIDEVAAHLNVSERTVRREVKAGRLRCVRVRRRLLFDPADVSRFVATRKE